MYDAAAQKRYREKHRERRNADKRAWDRANPEKVQRTRATTGRQNKTGVSEALATQLRELQGGRCGICPVQLVSEPGRRRQPAGEQADHFETLDGQRVPNYTKGAIKHPRGLLCQSCNVGLGRYEEHQRPAGLVLEPYERYLADPPARRL